jgi:NAD(P)H-flavin reductase
MSLRTADPAWRPPPLVDGATPDTGPMRPLPYRVTAVHRDNDDTFTLELQAPVGHQVAPFRPGQFNMLYVFGVGEVPISISGDPDRPEKLVHTTREVGAVTRAMRALRVGDAIGVRGPFGTSWPVDAAEGRDVVLIAGGIGLPPLRPALYHVLARRERYGRVMLLYGARTPEDMMFPRELAEWRSHFDLEVHITVDRATGNWRGNVGVVTPIVKRAPIDPRRTVAMICGPEIMIRFACEELARRGVSPQDTYVSLERNMKCAVGLCGHCQLGPHLVCRDGPVLAYDQVEHLLDHGEV